MADIRHRVGIAAPAERVYEALATREGVASWWTRTVEGESKPGGALQFFFGGLEASTTMQVVDLKPGQQVRWRCVQGPDEWLDTNVTFELKPADNETVLLFSHEGWREPVEFMNHCSTKWAVFLLGLKAGFEGGTFTPYPEEIRISSWS